MHKRAIIVLVLLLFLTSFYIVNVRHEHRLAYSRLHQSEIVHDELIDEWGQLLTEINLWAFPHRIEKDATDLLEMQKPAGDEVIYIDLQREPVSGVLVQSSLGEREQ